MSSYALCTVVLSSEGQVSGADLRDVSDRCGSSRCFRQRPLVGPAPSQHGSTRADEGRVPQGSRVDPTPILRRAGLEPSANETRRRPCTPIAAT